MGRTIGVDFESTYHKGVRGASELGPMAYAMHLDTDIFLVAIDTGEECIVDHPENIDWSEFTRPGDQWVSHNRTFDAACYHRVQADAAPNTLPDPELWHCSADLAAHLGVQRGLKDAVKYLLGEEVPKEERNKFNRKSREEILRGDTEALFDYAANDAYYTRELWVRYQDEFPEHEQWLSRYTTKSCLRGVGVDVDFVERSIQSMKEVVFGLTKRMPWVGQPDKKGKPYTPESRSGLFAHCAASGIDAPPTTAKDSPKFDEWVARYAEQADFASALHEYRSARKLLGDLTKVSERVCVDTFDDWVMPFAMKYKGAHTMRWSGDGGLNMQNPARDAKFGIKFRHIFIPRFDDTLFVACDLSQIEARVLLWEVRDTAQLDLIRAGMDLYEAHARQTMGYTDPRPMSEADVDGRRYAKARVLGLGYSAGGKTFKNYAWSQHKLELTLQQATQEVKNFRKKNPSIVRYWTARTNAVIRGSKATGDYYEELPSGEFLYYRDVVKDESGRGWKAINQMGRGHRFFHGGLLTENRCSAISRDLVGLAIRRIESNKHTPVIWTMHDEVIVEVPRAHAEECQQEIEDKLTQIPSWADGLPVACESAILERYDK